MAQSLGQPILLTLSEILLKQRRQYYNMLQAASSSLLINDWIKYFGQIIIDAQQAAITGTEFILSKNKFFTRHTNDLNERQIKVLKKVFDSGPSGFEGGLNAEKYISMTRTSRSTATRDLAELLALGVLIKTGTGKGTRYYLHLN